jgi:hypothetical protein
VGDREVAVVILCIDFDGTLVEHAFPDVGPEVPGAFAWLERFRAAGAKLVLWTCRSDDARGKFLTAAVEFCRLRGIEFYGVNRNPGQAGWSGSPKAFANLYVDDAALGCPLVHPEQPGRRPYVDWSKAGPAVLALLERRTP